MWQSIVSRGTRFGLSVRVARVSGSPRAFNRRDDKAGIFTMKGMKRLEFSRCHCEEEDRTTRQSIVSRGSRTGCLFAY